MASANIPVVNPTETEKVIWQCLTPRKGGGLVRQGSAKHPHDLFGCCYGPRDKTDPGHWACKMKGGVRAEWWAYMMEGTRRIVDVGCGFGFPSFYLASCGHEVVGVDPSPSQIATAERYRQEEGPSYCLAYRVIEETTLPFEDDSFDGATFGHSLECLGEPEALVAEAIRVLKPGAPLAFHEEDRAAEVRTHPVWESRPVDSSRLVWESRRLTVIDDLCILWVESRLVQPYLDRRYLIRLRQDGEIARRFRAAAPEREFAWGVTLDDAALSVEEVLAEAEEGEYCESRGHDAYTLCGFLEGMGLADLRFWTINDGQQFARELVRAGVARDMPDDLRAVWRALVRSIEPLTTPTVMVSCRAPVTGSGQWAGVRPSRERRSRPNRRDSIQAAAAGRHAFGGLARPADSQGDRPGYRGDRAARSQCLRARRLGGLGGLRVLAQAGPGHLRVRSPVGRSARRLLQQAVPQAAGAGGPQARARA